MLNLFEAEGLRLRQRRVARTGPSDLGLELLIFPGQRVDLSGSCGGLLCGMLSAEEPHLVLCLEIELALQRAFALNQLGINPLPDVCPGFGQCFE